MASATGYWAIITEWGYLPIFLVTFGTFVAAIWGINGVVWLRRLRRSSQFMAFGQQDDLYDEVKWLYNGKVTFYHFSGTRVPDIVVMLFKHGFTIHLLVENLNTAHNLGCDYQQQRIDNIIARLMNKLRESGTRGRIETYYSEAPLTLRAALFHDRHIVLSWYIYQTLKTPTKGFPNDKAAVWGHDGWGLIMDNPHPQFKFAREFVERYEKRICATKQWSYP
ncbi:MAG: hypothetical protein ACREDM_07825 [Methylocella sp.]